MSLTAEAFNNAAKGYDHDFTFSSVGIEQRKRVLHYYKKYLPPSPSAILELNCGTGEDAMFLASKGYSITSTDVSEKMIEIAERKKAGSEIVSPDFKVLDMVEISTIIGENNYQSVVSNFGGVNCIDPNEINDMSKNLATGLSKGNKVILVVMGTGCLWDKLYYFFKKGYKVAKSRRRNSPIEVPVENQLVKTWFYKPSELVNLFKSDFDKIHLHPIGLFIPPSYLNNWFKNKKFILSVLVLLEKFFSYAGFMANRADHYILVLQRR